MRTGFPLAKAMDFLQLCGAVQCKAEKAHVPQEDQLSMDAAECEEYLNDIRRLADHYIQYLSSARKPMDYRLSSKIVQLLLRSRRVHFCPAGERMFGVAANGDLYPCALHVGRPRAKLGKLESGLNLTKQRAFLQRFGLNNECCSQCWARYLCGGGCSAMVDRFGRRDCLTLQLECEVAIAVFQHFAELDSSYLYGLVSPYIVRWIHGPSGGAGGDEDY